MEGRLGNVQKRKLRHRLSFAFPLKTVCIRLRTIPAEGAETQTIRTFMCNIGALIAAVVSMGMLNHIA